MLDVYDFFTEGKNLQPFGEASGLKKINLPYYPEISM